MYLPKLIHQAPRYVLASALCSFGGFLFGYDKSNSSVNQTTDTRSPGWIQALLGQSPS